MKEIANNRFLQAVAQDAINTPALKAAAAESPAAFERALRAALPQLMSRRLERDAELVAAITANGKQSPVAIALCEEVWREVRASGEKPHTRPLSPAAARLVACRS
jgi:hypothetical protein